jgi:palmitoyltransferase
MAELEIECDKRCLLTNDVKPARSHTCSVAGQVVFTMDHFCPWVNNTVGLENRRYFLLFCFYLFIGAIYMVITLHSIKHTHALRKSRGLFEFLKYLDYILTVIMFMFTVFNWYTAMTGQTIIEWQQRFRDKEKRYDFRLSRWSDNLYIIFGTTKLFRIISPSMRNVPLNGIEWAFLMKELGYEQTGKPIQKTLEKDVEM